MNRNQKSRLLNRLEHAAGLRGNPSPQAVVLPFDNALLLDYLAGACNLEDFLTGMHSSLTIDNVFYAEALVPGANASGDDNQASEVACCG